MTGHHETGEASLDRGPKSGSFESPAFREGIALGGGGDQRRERRRPLGPILIVANDDAFAALAGGSAANATPELRAGPYRPSPPGRRLRCDATGGAGPNAARPSRGRGRGR